MLLKRKSPTAPSRPPKRRKSSESQSAQTGKVIKEVRQTVLSSYYPNVLTLKQFLLSRIPRASRLRRRKIQEDSEKSPFLETTLIGVLQIPKEAVEETRRRDFVTFTQTQQRQSHSSLGSAPACNINEVVEFVVWLLFHKSTTLSSRPQHILCHGFQRDVTLRATDKILEEGLGIPGLVQQHPNENLDALKTEPWIRVSSLLGANGNIILQSLLLDCGIYIKLSTGADNYYQLSGVPITDLSPIAEAPKLNTAISVLGGKPVQNALAKPFQPGQILFARNRILYAKPSLNGEHRVKFGMKHIQVLNRFPDSHSSEQTSHIMKYVFPRQYGLHNVFTCGADKRETGRSVDDYTLRENEIARVVSRKKAGSVPKRLRTGPFSLVRKLQRNQGTCPYVQLLRYYCSSKQSPSELAQDFSKTECQLLRQCTSLATQQSPKAPNSSVIGRHADRLLRDPCPSVTDHATPLSQVSAFCCAVLTHLLPSDTFGTSADGKHNLKSFFASVIEFVRQRRFETLTLHQVSQSVKIGCIGWLRPPRIAEGVPMSQSDTKKRTEIFNEFLYYIFDSVLIPLIRTNFYVTESGVHGKRLFYFRHDVWQKMFQPSVANLRLTMFELLSPEATRKLLSSRSLGCGHVRLLPKICGMRTIVNLRRQTMTTNKEGIPFNTSVNRQLAAVFNMLKYERQRQPSALGSAVFSVGGIHEHLKSFKRKIGSLNSTRLYFVKVDIRSCFDTIPQDQLIEMVEQLISEENYRISNYCELKPNYDRFAQGIHNISRKFLQRAVPMRESGMISQSTASKLAISKKAVLFTDTGRQHIWQSKALLNLLREHVRNNIVKLGKKHFRQRNGIPQGSVLSSLLCSFFYGQFEREHLSFLDPGSSILLRLIDDFLLITTQEPTARKFLEVMADGVTSYGISVNPSKSLTNFQVSLQGSKIPRHHGTTHFPYCGVAIDMKTLEISKDREKKDLHIRNTLTVEAGRSPGQTFHRRIQTFLKIQMHAMLLDTTHNTSVQVMSNLFENFTETAIKLHQYSASLGANKRPSQEMVIDVVKELIGMAFNLVRSKLKVCGQGAMMISRAQMGWIACAAFEQVLRRKQSRYTHALIWISKLRESCETGTKLDSKTLEKIVDSGKAFTNYVF